MSLRLKPDMNLWYEKPDGRAKKGIGDSTRGCPEYQSSDGKKNPAKARVLSSWGAKWPSADLG